MALAWHGHSYELTEERYRRLIDEFLTDEFISIEEPSLPPARHVDRNEHGTAQDVLFKMDEHMSDIPHPLRLPFE